MIGIERVLTEIKQERYRQQTDEGFDHEHDDLHDGEQLLHAAQAYFWAATAPSQTPGGSMLAVRADGATMCVPRIWPWEPKWWKPSDGRRMLVKAGALCVAETERWHRLGDLESAVKAQQLLCRIIFYILRGDGHA